MWDFLKKCTGHFLPSSDNAYRPHLLRKPWLLFFLTVVLTAEGLYVAGIIAQQSAQDFLSAVLPGEVIALTNNERAQAGDGAVAESALLALAAQNKANDMAAKGYFSHTGPDGKEPWSWISEAGYAYRYAGENLAVRFDESSDVVRAWMASPTHRANIVKPVYTEIGIGVAQGFYEGAPATFVVQYFGTPMLAQAQVSTQAQHIPVISEATAVGGVPPEAVIAGAETEEAQTEPPASAAPAQAETPAAVSPPAAQEQSAVRVEAQTLLRASETSKASIAWILGGVAALLILLVALTVLVHIEIQPTEMVLGGVFVGMVAMSMLMLNGAFYQKDTPILQTAAVSDAFPKERSIRVGEATFIEVPGL